MFAFEFYVRRRDGNNSYNRISMLITFITHLEGMYTIHDVRFNTVGQHYIIVEIILVSSIIYNFKLSIWRDKYE